MIFDRYGTIEAGVFTYYPNILKAGKLYGFWPDDFVYEIRHRYERGHATCRVCKIHDARERRFPCDVMQARIDSMEEAGYPATICFSCRYAMPVRAGQSKYRPTCWFCERPRRDRPNRSGSGAYIPDGLGCVEKVPGWMADWDGRPVHGEPQ